MGYQLVETIEVGSGGASSIEFTGIPQDGVDLQILISGRGSRSATDSQLRVAFNGDTASNYDVRKLTGESGSVTSSAVNFNSVIFGEMSAATATANTFGSSSVYISNYTSSAAKSLSTDSVTENNATQNKITIAAGAWSGTAAITSLLLTTNVSFVQYSTASLYKITAD